MKYWFITVLLCLTLVSCTTSECTVTMTGVYDAADSVTMTITMAGTASSDLIFTIDGVPYTVSDAPVVSDPVYRLKTAEEDGMASVAFYMAADETSVCELHMIPSDGRERVYFCEREELSEFAAWVRSN